MQRLAQRKLSTAILIVVLSFSVALAVSIFRRLLLLGYVDSAIGSVRAIVAQEANYAKAHPDLGYTCALADLPSDELTNEVVKTGRRNGFAFEINGCGAEGGKNPSRTYQVTARPLHADMPAFCSDQSGVVRSDESGSLTSCLQHGAPL
jgi:hypothetical protein